MNSHQFERQHKLMGVYGTRGSFRRLHQNDGTAQEDGR